MKIKRDRLRQHLRKIMCGSQVAEAVFSGAFATAALTLDQLLLVVAPPLSATEGLTEDVGVPDLVKLTKALDVIAGSGNEAVDVDVEVVRHRLVLNEAHRGVLRLLTAAPRTIGTRVEGTTVAQLLAKVPTGHSIPLTRQFIEGIQRTFSLFNADEVELFLGPDGGRVRVGNADADLAEFASGELRAPTAYSLLFGPQLVDVLGIVSDFSRASLRLGGPKDFALIEDGDYKYVLAPRQRAADAAPPREEAPPATAPATDTAPEPTGRKKRGAKAKAPAQV